MPIGRGKKPGKSSSAPQAPEEHHVICPDFDDVQPDSEPEDSQGIYMQRSSLSVIYFLSLAVAESSRRKRSHEQGPGLG